MDRKNISDYGEKALIKRIIEKSSNFNNLENTEFISSIGDDCSVMKFNGKYLTSTSDMLIQSSHFPDSMSYFDMGFKAVTVNISDLASMGAEPIGFLLNIAIPKDLNIKDFDSIIDGVVSACKYYNIPLIGGDTNHYNEIIISGTAFGTCEKEPMMKYGFNIGDLVCLTGKIGLAPLGFDLLLGNYNISKELNKVNSLNITEIDKCENIYELAIFKALKPEARINEGKILLNNGIKTGTDITDGLASEFESILSSDKKYSKYLDLNNYSKGIRIYEDMLPVDKDYINCIKKLNLNLYNSLFHVGEDFELLFTINKSQVDKLSKKLDFYIIGEITDNNTVEMILKNGEVKTISSKGYNHFDASS
ncbi:thiamine-phosphate kinase [Methanobrevibacter sp. 87.7]|uniref:thiamine-phosphate kinase n=1 Tax=Methanobrevibacter sp. 87.7 TaxID=387957 RepID=UPI000B50ED60|nr:thiamine-phosphate kinase [Methanobrevibacter sp. 87.7]OWT33483.1 thiamine-phosphate kinase [Methanobrevibacter sp. 87.7]